MSAEPIPSLETIGRAMVRLWTEMPGGIWWYSWVVASSQSENRRVHWHIEIDGGRPGQRDAWRGFFDNGINTNIEESVDDAIATARQWAAEKKKKGATT